MRMFPSVCRWPGARVCLNLCIKSFMQYGPSAHLLPCSVTHRLQFKPARWATRLMRAIPLGYKTGLSSL